MASPSSPDASEIRRRGRQRLIGAVALVLLLVVFVPMILDSEPRPTRPEPTIAIPPKEGAAPLPAPATSPPPAAQAPAAQQPEPGATSAVAPSAPVASAAAPSSGFAVQVGAFRDE